MLEAGEAAPDFELLDQDGRKAKLSAFRLQGCVCDG